MGADMLILGFTEIGLLVHAEDFDMPAFDTTHPDADAAIRLALASGLDRRSLSGRTARSRKGHRSSAPPHRNWSRRGPGGEATRVTIATRGTK